MRDLKSLIYESMSGVMSIPEAFKYCSKLGGPRFSWETVVKDEYYEISPCSDYSFNLLIDRKHGPVITGVRGRRMPNKFTMDKSIQTKELYISEYSYGETYEYWRPTKEVIDKLMDACKY